MVVNSDFLLGARTLFMALFDEVMGAPQVQWSTIADNISTQDRDTLTLNWLGAPPQMRTVKGEIDIGKAFPHDYSIVVDEKGVAIEVKERAFRSQGLGTVSRLVQNMMFQAARFYDKLVFEQLSDGFTLLGYDGKAFFANDHAVGDADTLDNSLALDFSETNYGIAWATLNLAQDDAGEPMGLIASHLVGHPNDRTAIRKVLNAQLVSSGETNVLAGDSTPLISPYIKDSDSWFLLAAEGLATKPIILAEQMAIRFVAQDDLGGESAFMKKVFRYKVEAEVAPGYGLFQQAVGSAGA